MNEIIVGQWVERLGSEKDYTTGRTGEVVEIKDDRCRVRWLLERNGKEVFFGAVKPKNWNGVRTWVNKKFLKSIEKK